jgi:hypothetical protein
MLLTNPEVLKCVIVAKKKNPIFKFQCQPENLLLLLMYLEFS